MSLSAEFRHKIKPLIIMNSIFNTGLMEYFVDIKINTIESSLIKITYRLYFYNIYLYQIGSIIFGVFRRKKTRRFTLQIETCIRTMDQLNIPMNLPKYFRQQYYYSVLYIVFVVISMIVIDYKWFISFGSSYWKILIFFYVIRYPFIVLLVVDITFVFWMRQIKFSQLNEVLKGMLTTTIHSPQHKRILRMRNGKNNSPSSDVHRTDKSNKDGNTSGINQVC
uniref:Uncharacterized protein n=1 Tax=Vespula pensylvanica TaxID=30213 RepID=A0A834PAB2_VESPE|nr:hypothetical protein H0235_002546 [Vespula pensylvanica]